LSNFKKKGEIPADLVIKFAMEFKLRLILFSPAKYEYRTEEGRDGHLLFMVTLVMFTAERR
jgi:hypothetical protein